MNPPLKLTLRDLFWLILVVAIALGWWVNHHSFAELDRLRNAERATNAEFARKLSKRDLALKQAEFQLERMRKDDGSYREAYFYLRERAPKKVDDPWSQ